MVLAYQHSNTQKKHDKISLFGGTHKIFHCAINNADKVSSYSRATILHFEGYLKWKGYFRVLGTGPANDQNWLRQGKGKAKHRGLLFRTLSLGLVKNVTRRELVIV